MELNQNSETASATDNNAEGYLEHSPESKFRQTAAQCIAMISPATSMATYGISIGYSTILIPELYKPNAEVVVTLSELTWISSMSYFMNPLGALITGPLLDRLGRRSLILMGSVTYVTSWIIFYGWGTSAWALLLGFGLTGIAGGIADPACQIYASEIADLRLRGAISTSITVAISFGYFFQILTNMYIKWRTLALINIICPAVSVILTFFAPESPHWLASKGRNKDTERALRWLRGWRNFSSVRKEYNSVVEFANGAEKTAGSQSCQHLLQIYFRRAVLLPFALLTFAFFLSSFNGTVSILSYSVLIFEKLESPINEYTATLILAALQVLGPTLLMSTVHWIGKRKPTLASLIIAGLCFLAIAAYSFLKGINVIRQDVSHSWIPMTLVLLTIFVSAGGIRCTPWFIAGELFPVEVRGVAVGILSAICNITAALASKSFLYKLEAFSLPGTFLFFAIINFVGFVVLYWTMPETEGKTFAEIETYFAGKPTVPEKFTYT